MGLLTSTYELKAQKLNTFPNCKVLSTNRIFHLVPLRGFAVLFKWWSLHRIWLHLYSYSKKDAKQCAVSTLIQLLLFHIKWIRKILSLQWQGINIRTSCWQWWILLEIMQTQWPKLGSSINIIIILSVFLFHLLNIIIYIIAAFRDPVKTEASFLEPEVILLQRQRRGQYHLISLALWMLGLVKLKGCRQRYPSEYFHRLNFHTWHRFFQGQDFIGLLFS